MIVGCPVVTPFAGVSSEACPVFPASESSGVTTRGQIPELCGSAWPMNRLMRFPDAIERDPEIEAWMDERSDALGTIARHWFGVIRERGDDVRELLHDGHPTACVADAAFAYVNAFTAHVNVGFFRGAELADPAELLEGTGKYMRHVKLRSGADVDATALIKLVNAAYLDMKGRIEAE